MDTIPTELLTAYEMRAADAAAIASGTPGIALMENAGGAVAEHIGLYESRPVLVVCGGGNNGGDGFIIARLLKERGWPVTVALTVDAKALKGDAATAYQRMGIPAAAFSPAMLTEAKLVVDAIFGTGLARAPESVAAQAIQAIVESKLPVIAVDMPSGVSADTGEVFGPAISAEYTVTFCRAKPGLFLLPGKVHAGEVIVADIGIPLISVPRTQLNAPSLWRHALRTPSLADHKYTRGAVLVQGGPLECTGASRLAALAALRIGAGHVSIACSAEALPVYAAALTSVMTKTGDMATLTSDKKITSLVLGPGAGVTRRTRDDVLVALATKKPCVLDADALTVFADDRNTLLSALHPHAVLTPHEGEFARLFGGGDKLRRARNAAAEAGCTVLLKGNDTVIAAPTGQAVINASAPPWLATAGAGDVLAGAIAGLMAQGAPAFEAACAGAWLHGVAAALLGPGLIAEDVPAALPRALASC